MKILLAITAWLVMGCAFLVLSWVIAEVNVRFQLWQERREMRKTIIRRCNFQDFTNWAGTERKKNDG
jgi:hypothetical protein